MINKNLTDKWSKCFCDKEQRDPYCRACQIYQLIYGLRPTCAEMGDYIGKPLLRNKGYYDPDQIDYNLLEIQRELQKEEH